MSKPIYHIAAMAQNGVIGREQKLPWRIPEEWDYFISTTAGGIMVMGRICAEEFGEALSDRDMIAITRQKDFSLPGFQVAHSIEESIKMAQVSPQAGPIWVCGGETIYLESLEMTSRLYMSHIHQDFEGDRRYPKECLEVFQERLSCEPSLTKNPPFDICVYEKQPRQ